MNLALLIPILALLIPIVAILSGTFTKIAALRSETSAQLGRATEGIERALADAQADRDRLRRRVEALEAIVTSEGYDLEREARAAGITGGAGRIDAGLLDVAAPPEPSEAEPPAQRQRAR